MAITIERLNELLAKATNPDVAPLALDELKTEITAALTELGNSSNIVAERDKQISNLRDTNMALFLRTTGTPPTGEPKEETPDETFDRLFTKQVFGGNDNGND